MSSRRLFVIGTAQRRQQPGGFARGRDAGWESRPDREEINPLGVKGVGEIGIVGTAAAIANAVYHATGRRVRDLPITIDKLMP